MDKTNGPGRALRAILFDFDGTLADSYAAITASVNHVRERYHLPPLSVAEVRPHVGHGPANLLSHTVPGCNPELDQAHYRAHHPSVMFQLTALLPGVAEGLPALAARGLRLAVCSNKPVAFTRQLLEHLGVRPLFEAVLGPEDVAQPKPAPDMLLAALGRLRLPADEVLYVGDMVVDIQTARAAGVRVWVIPTGSDDRAALQAGGPDGLLRSFAEVPTRV